MSPFYELTSTTSKRNWIHKRSVFTPPEKGVNAPILHTQSTGLDPQYTHVLTSPISLHGTGVTGLRERQTQGPFTMVDNHRQM